MTLGRRISRSLSDGQWKRRFRRKWHGNEDEGLTPDNKGIFRDATWRSMCDGPRANRDHKHTVLNLSTTRVGQFRVSSPPQQSMGDLPKPKSLHGTCTSTRVLCCIRARQNKRLENSCAHDVWTMVNRLRPARAADATSSHTARRIGEYSAQKSEAGSFECNTGQKTIFSNCPTWGQYTYRRS